MEINKKKLKIGIFTWYNKPYKHFGDIFYEINKKYCDKHNYDCINCSIDRVNLKGFTKHWERYALLYSYLDKDYDYLVWIDADAHFYINSPPLSNIIKNYEDKTFILSGDWDQRSGAINSGFFIVKNNNLARYFLKEIYNNLDWLEKKSKRWYDQATLRYIYKHNIDNFKNISTIVPYPVLQSFPGCKPFYSPLSTDNFIKNIKETYYNKFQMIKPLILHYVGRKNIAKEEATKYLDLINTLYPNFPPENEEYLSIH